jgi:hypothetical protein
MFLVALAELVGDPEAEAEALAGELGSTVYETRMLLAGGLPAVLVRTADKAAAQAQLARLRGRGHGAVACDAGAVSSQERMVPFGHFRLDPDALRTDTPTGTVELPYDDVLALLRASHRIEQQSEREISTTRFDMRRAVMTGGLVPVKQNVEKTTVVREDREQLLYVFRRSGAMPWMLREGGAKYQGLGADMGASRLENFLRVVQRLRERCGAAAYDERLLRFHPRGAQSHAGSRELDERAHLLALWYARAARGPYR